MSIDNNQYCAAAYLRLSKYKAVYSESGSITNQRELIKSYLSNKNNISLCKEYVDDGYSGSNFDRPSFKEMIEQLKKGSYNCIIVKDLSRIGRDYIEVGKYISRVFPFLGVRLISINENYDSLYSNFSDFISIPIHNIINDSYCKDISKKIKSHIAVRMFEGYCVSPFTIYGYSKCNCDNSRIVVDSFAADVVKDIFLWKIRGMSCEAIAKRLNDNGILSPYEYKKSLGLNYQSGFKKNVFCKWSAVAVRKILQNEMYTGVMIQGKTYKPNHRVKNTVKKPKEQWIRVSDTHEPIISKHDFENVQRLLSYDTRTSPNQSGVYIFSGILKCKDCKENLVRRPVNSGGKKYIYYYCSTYKKYKSCSSHRISHEKLENILIEFINKQIDCFVSYNISATDSYDLSKHYSRIEVIKKEIDRYRNLKLSLYENFVDGILCKDDYEELKKIYTERINYYENSLFSIQSELNNNVNEERKNNIDSFISNNKIKQFNRELIVMLIKEIRVGNDKTIDIYFNFRDFQKEGVKLVKSKQETI